MSENERLKLLQKELNFPSQTAFADALGIKQGSLSDIYRQKSGVGVSGTIKMLLEKLYDINVKWLETGKGSMFNKQYDAVVKKAEPILANEDRVEYNQTAAEKSIRKPKTINNEKKPKGMPVYEAAPATLSNIESYRDEHIDADNPDYWLSIPQYRKCNYATRAKGDSMHPIIKNNAIVGGREINDIKVIVFGEIYIVHTKNGIETVKYIHPHETDADIILLVPYNGNAKTTPVHKSEIQRLYLAEFTINPL